MKTAAAGHCHCEACSTSALLERPRYFPRQLLTPVDLTLEQQYFRDRMRRHNRLLHGWGVVCGATVCRVAETPPSKPTPGHHDDAEAPPAGLQVQPWKVRVTSGYVLGPYGDEILLEGEQVIDLRTLGSFGTGDPCEEAADPWCREVLTPREAGVLYVAVRYREALSRPVRVQPAGCGCDESQCEFSRWRDGCEIGVLTECPESHHNPPPLEGAFQGPVPDCPECPSSPWVVLARVDLEADGTITTIDNCSCRRMVLSASRLWWRCSGDACPDLGLQLEGDRTPQAGRVFTLTAAGGSFPKEVKVSLGIGVTVLETKIEDAPPRLVIKARAEPQAAAGWRALKIRDASTGEVVITYPNAVRVVAAPKPPVPPGPGPAPKPKGKGGRG